MLHEKSTGLSCTWLDLLARQELVTLYIGHLEFTGSLGYAGHLNPDTFYKTIFKPSHSFTSPLILLEKFVSTGKLSNDVGDDLAKF